jgi:NitT/TauT family transport system substrate-binding protein
MDRREFRKTAPGAGRMPTFRALVCLAVLLAFPLASGVRAQAPIKVTAAYVGTVSDVGLYLADKKGYFRDEGLDVALTQIDLTNRMVPTLGTGDLDVGSGTIAAGLYNAVSRDIGLRVVADKGSVRAGYGYEGLLVRKDLVESGRYKSFADLKGMTIALGSLGSGNASVLNQALKRGGLRFSDANVVTLRFPQHLVAYINKGIDASITNEPTITLALEKGVAVKIAGNDKIHPSSQTAVLFYSEKFSRERAGAAHKFMRAYIRAVRDYNDALVDVKIAGPNADEVIAVLQQYTPIKDTALLRKITPAAVNPDGRVNLEGMNIDLAFYKEEGLIQDRTMTAEKIVDMSFVDAVVKELGPYRSRANR